MSKYMYSSPDGEDCILKIFDLSKNFGLVGLFFGINHTVGRDIAKGQGLLYQTLHCVRWVGPWVGTACIFSSVVCISAHIRGKDSPLNHGIAAAAAMTVPAHYVGVARGIVGATWAAAAMAFLKDNHGDPSWRNITPGTGVWVAGGRLGGGNEMPHLPPESSKIKPTDY